MYYLFARPETIVHIIKHGILPERLPIWVQPQVLVCNKSMSACFPAKLNSHHQSFVIQIDVPKVNNENKESFIVEKVLVNNIKRIFVYSEQGARLLNKLFGDKCPAEIMVEPFLFPEEVLESKKRNRDMGEVASSSAATSNKIIALGLSSNNQVAIPAAINQNTSLSKPVIERISSNKEHLALLYKAFIVAKNSVLVTSFSINEETLFKSELHELIPLARSRGIKIYIYYNDSKELTKKIVDFLKQNDVAFSEAYTHSKILAVDRNFVATGSCNWLSLVDSRYPESDEGTFVLRGEICQDLIEDFWSHIRHYRNIQHGNYRAVNRFESNSENQSTVLYELEERSELGYLPTLEQHEAFIQDCMDDAKSRVIICSPFISSNEQYLDDIDHEILLKTISRGVEIFFVCSQASPMLDKFGAFLSEVASPKIHLITMPYIHLKTIIMDENIIGEGSFNWLSASRYEDSDYHNHEQTLYVEGPMAKSLIDKFFQSRTGLVIRSEMENSVKLGMSAFFAKNKAIQDAISASSAQVVQPPKRFGGCIVS